MDEQDKQKLTELATGFRIFIKEWDEIKENGFRQCGVNDSRIEALQRSFIWLRNLVITLILLTLTASIGYVVGDKNGYDGNQNTTRGHILDSKSDGAWPGHPKSSKSLGQG